MNIVCIINLRHAPPPPPPRATPLNSNVLKQTTFRTRPKQVPIAHHSSSIPVGVEFLSFLKPSFSLVIIVCFSLSLVNSLCSLRIELFAKLVHNP